MRWIKFIKFNQYKKITISSSGLGYWFRSEIFFSFKTHWNSYLFCWPVLSNYWNIYTSWSSYSLPTEYFFIYLQYIFPKHFKFDVHYCRAYFYIFFRPLYLYHFFTTAYHSKNTYIIPRGCMHCHIFQRVFLLKLLLSTQPNVFQLSGMFRLLIPRSNKTEGPLIAGMIKKKWLIID